MQPGQGAGEGAVVAHMHGVKKEHSVSSIRKLGFGRTGVASSLVLAGCIPRAPMAGHTITITVNGDVTCGT